MKLVEFSLRTKCSGTNSLEANPQRDAEKRWYKSLYNPVLKCGVPPQFFYTVQSSAEFSSLTIFATGFQSFGTVAVQQRSSIWHWDHVLLLPIIFLSLWERRNVSVNIQGDNILVFRYPLLTVSPQLLLVTAGIKKERALSYDVWNVQEETNLIENRQTGGSLPFRPGQGRLWRDFLLLCFFHCGSYYSFNVSSTQALFERFQT